MRKYTPFLKLKVNEIGALGELPADIYPKITPFFDLPHKKDRTAEELVKLITASAKKLRKLADRVPRFFLDLYDIPDDLIAHGSGLFNAVAQEFKGLDFIPVIGLDRSNGYINSVFSCQAGGQLKSQTLGIRLVDDDYQSYAACKSDISSLVAGATGAGFKDFTLILDMRLCANKSQIDLSSTLSKFLTALGPKPAFKEIIITGSTITAQIGELVPTESETIIDRVELATFQLLNYLPKTFIGFGDHTVVSPNYSEMDLAKEFLRNVTAPKIVYSYDDAHYVARGGALKSHSRGNAQYYDMALPLVRKPFFRGAFYSFGENFLLEKAAELGPLVTPSSILKPTICAHMTYMVRAHPLFI